MSLRIKLALGAIFSLAVITTIIAIVRTINISALSRQPEVSWLYMWSSIEQCIGKKLFVTDSVDDIRERVFQSSICLRLSAIIVACLASFRSLFADQRARIAGPKHRPSNDSRNMFLRGIRRTIPSRTTLELRSIFRSHGRSATQTSGIDNSHAWRLDVEASTNHIFFPDRALLKTSGSIYNESERKDGTKNGVTHTDTKLH